MAKKGIEFKVGIKITDAVFIIRKVKRDYKMKAVLKVFAEVGGATLIDGEVKETEVPRKFKSEAAAEKYATEKAREFKLERFRIINSARREYEIEL